jgi:flagellar motility protein MotE (MotC chaperone)
MNEFLKSCWEKLRLLPLLIVVASLAFLVRVGEATLEVRSLSGAAFAEETKKPEDGVQKTEEGNKNAEDVKKAEGVEDKTDNTKKTEGGEQKAEGAKTIEAVKAETKDSKDMPEKPKDPKDPKATDSKWKDASDADLDYSEVRQDVYKDLLARRKQLDEREKNLKAREAIVTATQKEINEKVKELTSLRTELQGFMKKQTDEEEANTTKLVKIYEGMKPKDAARIFNELDMDVLIAVVSKMSERKTAPVIAAMNPEKARTLTLMLSEQKKLPDLTIKESSEDSTQADQASSSDPLQSLGQERDQNTADAPPEPPMPPVSQ